MTKPERLCQVLLGGKSTESIAERNGVPAFWRYRNQHQLAGHEAVRHSTSKVPSALTREGLSAS